MAQLMNSVSFYTFRLGKKLAFVGPYPSYPEEPQPSPLDFSRRSSAPSIGGHSPVDGSGRGAGMPSESPVDRAKAAAKMLLPRLGWHPKPDVSVSKDHDDTQWNGYENGWHGGGGAGGRSTGSTPTASVTTASVSDSSGRGFHGGGGDGSRRRGQHGGEGSRIERAVREALDR